VILRAKRPDDNAALTVIWDRTHAGAVLITRGHSYDARDLEGFVAEDGGRMVGALTYAFADGECEVATLDSWDEDKGVGTALLAAVVDLARARGARRAWLITSNDNIRAIRFYQKRGWDLVAVHRFAIDEARKQKPDIPLVGDNDIPIRHEIEFELRLR
jgi:ribosomal protein S18 acetylase RimI-like enzyme